MIILGIDPAPVKNSVVFDGVKFRTFTPYNLKKFIQKLTYKSQDIFIAWDAPLSGAIEKTNLNLYERKIEKYFNRNNKKVRNFLIPKGISTLGYAGCSHWTISQYIFGYPNLNEDISINHSFKLVQNQSDINYENGFQLTEIHPALSMWIVLKDSLSTHPLFIDTWQYKGANAKDKLNPKRREIIIDTLISIDFVKKEIDLEPFKDELMLSDDKLDTFFCWLLGKKLINKQNDILIYGDKSNGSFLLPYSKYIKDDLDRYLNS